MHDGKDGCNTIEYTTASQYSDRLYFLWHGIKINVVQYFRTPSYKMLPNPSLPLKKVVFTTANFVFLLLTCLCHFVSHVNVIIIILFQPTPQPKAKKAEKKKRKRPKKG